MKTALLLSLLLFSLASQAQTITTIAGNGTPGYSGDGGPATAAQLKNTAGIAVDTAGNLYIGDDKAVIRKVNTLGVITTIAGNDTTGFSGDGGPAVLAKIYPVWYIAVDMKGNVFLADGSATGRIRRIDKFGIINTYAGNGGTTFSGMGGPATAASIGTARGICCDDTGNLYINGGGYIYKVDTFGIIKIFAGSGVLGHTGDGGRADTARIDGENQIAMDNNHNLYITEVNSRVRKISAAGIVSTFTGTGVLNYTGDGGPATAATFNDVFGVCPDRCGNVYVCDAANNRVRVVGADGIIKTFAGTGYGGVGSGSITTLTGGYTGDGGAATAAELFIPFMACVDKHGGVYFSDQNNNVICYVHMDSCINTTEVLEVTAGKGSFSVFPNPAQGAFTCVLRSSVSEPMHVAVTDITGKQITEVETASNKETEIRLHAPPGIYFISATTASGRWAAKIRVE